MVQLGATRRVASMKTGCESRVVAFDQRMPFASESKPRFTGGSKTRPQPPIEPNKCDGSTNLAAKPGWLL